jgi:bifunctional DNA-binding transcriptional regulator/antitoxin component of YhaV-PrlF toxin-antitoxin module
VAQWEVGKMSIVRMDDKGRVLIPKELRKRSKNRIFIAKIDEDGAIILEPVDKRVEELGGKYRNLIRKKMEEIEEAEEELLRRERGI